MSQLLEFIPIKQRVYRKRQQAIAPPGPLAVVRIENLHTISGDIVFDMVFNTTEACPLNSVASADAYKWTCRYQGRWFEGSSLQNKGFDRIEILLGLLGDDSGPDELNYAADPSDISDALGRELAAFGGMPL